MEEILRYFPDLTDNQKRQFIEAGDIYKRLNAQINVISRKDIDNIYPHHILHSLAIAKIMPLPVGSTVMDIGCGG
ncbi:MAG: class I SAM-dependent methyltransferase, partial [Rikenellaceae bacterium]|nr:class I SAM-dependent methyltransferase [Rikenellaceae bacterium]